MAIKAYNLGVIAASSTANVIEPVGPFRVAVTVPSTNIDTTLTDFPVYVDLSAMPSNFWQHLAKNDGGDIRVKNDDDSLIPLDLLQIARAQQTGHLFFKKTLTDNSDTTVYIHYGDDTLDLLPANDTYGRNAVWSDYHRVHVFGGSFVDRTGSNNNLTPTAVNLSPDQLVNITTSDDIGVHQGVAWDGTYYYVTDNNLIKKYNSSWSLMTSNTDPCGDVQSATGDAVNHCGDLCVVDGVLYVPIEVYVNISTWSLMKIARFNASDLSFIGADDIAAQGHEVSSICYRPDDDMLYISSYASGSFLFKYSRTDRSYQGLFNLTSPIPRIQGITFWRGAFWVNSDDYDATVRVTAGGVVQGRVWGITGGNYEGIDFNDAGLLILHDTTGNSNGVVRELRPLNVAVGGGVDLPGVSGRYLISSSTRYATWTIGVSVNFNDLPIANTAIASYGYTASNNNMYRATLAYRPATTQFGLWDQANTWLYDTLTPPDTNTTYRLHAIYNNTSYRKIYRDGENLQTAGDITAKPDVVANRVLLGVEDGDQNELMNGKIGFYYLRASELSADWIAAEYMNITTPNSFYNVGSEEDRGGGDLLVGWEETTIFGPAMLSNSDRTVSTNPNPTRVGVNAKNFRSSGKWYFEIIAAIGQSGGPTTIIGIAPPSWPHNNIVGYGSGVGVSFHGFSYNNDYTGDGNMGAPTPAATNAVTQFAIDLDSGRVWVGVNNVWKWSGNPTTNTNPIFTGIIGTYAPSLSMDSQISAWSVTLRETSSEFTYTPPTGFSPWSNT